MNEKVLVTVAIPKVRVPLSAGFCMLGVYWFGMVAHYLIHAWDSWWVSAVLGVTVGLAIGSICRYIASMYIVQIVKSGQSVQFSSKE